MEYKTMQVKNTKHRGSGRIVAAIIISSIIGGLVSPSYAGNPKGNDIITYRGSGRVDDVNRLTSNKPANINSGGCAIPPGQPLVCPTKSQPTPAKKK